MASGGSRKTGVPARSAAGQQQTRSTPARISLTDSSRAR